jgi:hypothetical protein
VSNLALPPTRLTIALRVCTTRYSSPP